MIERDRQDEADEGVNADAAEKREFRGKAAAPLQPQRQEEVEAREKRYVGDSVSGSSSGPEVATVADKSRRL